MNPYNNLYKNNIQRVIEQEDAKSLFKSKLNDLVESYEIKGNVFAIDQLHRPVEVSNGYFVEEKTFDNLSDCVNEMKINQAVSINENQFILGHVEQQLSACPTDTKVMDIEYLKYVR